MPRANRLRNTGGPGGRGGFNSSGAENVKLYVGNLSFDTTDEVLSMLTRPSIGGGLGEGCDE